jgi:hypothetical protein
MEAALFTRMVFEMSRAALALAGILYLVACDEWHLSVNSDGLVFISVTEDTGEPRHRFRIRTRRTNGTTQLLDVPTSGEVTLTSVADGSLELTLLTPDGCQVAGANPRTLAVAAGLDIRTGFAVRCA